MLIFVGGFLGAGKTSMLWQAARALQAEGKRVGLITNDQAGELVDTVFLEAGGTLTEEVSGSCFCCNFPGLMQAVEAHMGNRADVIIAEPVGSCTDLSATIMQPIKDKYPQIELAPLTVLADPYRLRGILADEPSAGAYIARKQLEEADIILINKTDLLTEAELSQLTHETARRWPEATVAGCSVKTGNGVEQWLKLVRSGVRAGTRLAEVDYDLYAAGEAAYGWLNARFALNTESAGMYGKASELLGSLKDGLGQCAGIGHIKFLMRNEGRIILGNMTDSGDSLRELNGDGTGLIVNVRAEMPPEALESAVLRAVDRVFDRPRCESMECLIPGRPNPTYRYTHVL